MDYIDPEGKYFDARLYRQHCIETHYPPDLGGSSFLKDLRIFANRRLSDLLILDNATLCFALQLDNGVPVLPFVGGGGFYSNSTEKYNSYQDDELLHLVKYLEEAFMSHDGVQDVRVKNRESFNLRGLVE